MLKHPNVVSSHQPLTPFNWRPFDLYNNVHIQNSFAFGHLLNQKSPLHAQGSTAAADTECFCCCYCCGGRHSIDRKLFTQPSDMDGETGQTFVANYRKLSSSADNNGSHHVRSRSVTDSCSESDKCCCCNSAIRNLVQLYFQSRDNKFQSIANNSGRLNQLDPNCADNLCAYKGQMMPTKGNCNKYGGVGGGGDRGHYKYNIKHYRANSCENVSIDVDASDKLMDIMPKRTHRQAPLESLSQWAAGSKYFRNSDKHQTTKKTTTKNRNISNCFCATTAT